MIDLAIAVGDTATGATLIETNRGDMMAASGWPQDSDFRLVAFAPGAKECEVIDPSELAKDIALALQTLRGHPDVVRAEPQWFSRLRKCAAGGFSS